MKVEKIDHVHIVVKDLEGAMKFFSDIMGTQFVGPIDHGFVRLAFDDAGLEVLSAVSPDTPWAKAAEKLEGGQGLVSIALKVRDLDEALRELEAKGIKCTLKMADLPGIRVAELDPADTYGLWIELIEYDTVHPSVFAQLGKACEIPFFKG